VNLKRIYILYGVGNEEYIPLWGRKRFHLPIVGSETLPSACWGRKRFHLPVTWGRKRFLLGIITLSETLPSACYTPSTC